MVTCTPLPSCINSVRSDSVKPSSACLAAQYADWSGMARYASADPTCTMVPRLRGAIRLSAASVPYTAPKYVTCVTRSNSRGVICRMGENTDTIALFTQTSIGPSSSSMRWAAASTASASATSTGRAPARKCARHGSSNACRRARDHHHARLAVPFLHPHNLDSLDAAESEPDYGRSFLPPELTHDS